MLKKNLFVTPFYIDFVTVPFFIFHPGFLYTDYISVYILRYMKYKIPTVLIEVKILKNSNNTIIVKHFDLV